MRFSRGVDGHGVSCALECWKRVMVQSKERARPAGGALRHHLMRPHRDAPLFHFQLELKLRSTTSRQQAGRYALMSTTGWAHRDAAATSGFPALSVLLK